MTYRRNLHLNLRNLSLLIERALAEDAAARDITSRTVLPPDARIRAAIIAKQSGILAGGPLAVRTFQTLDPSLRCSLKCREGACIAKGQTILTVEGRARSIFAAERTALNFLGHLCGIASLTHEYVRRVPRRTAILDTRKTLPGLRRLEKYAVASGGGANHRMDLADAVLIKTNHLRVVSGQPAPARIIGGPGWSVDSGTIQKAVKRARKTAGKKFTEIEVANLREFKSALSARPDAILLDNWRIPAIRRAVQLRNHSTFDIRHSTLLEVSGGVTLANVRAIARTGVERISIGRLTHSAPSLDISLKAIV